MRGEGSRRDRERIGAQVVPADTAERLLGDPMMREVHLGEPERAGRRAVRGSRTVLVGYVGARAEPGRVVDEGSGRPDRERPGAEAA